MAVIDLGGNNYDSFITQDDATVYLAGDVSRAPGWALLASDAQKRALISSTRMLQTMPWCDDPPPDPAVDPADQVIQDVTAMLAADLAAKPKLFADASGSTNVKSVKAGSVNVEFFSPVAGGAPIPMALWNRLLAAGLVCLGTTGATSINDGPFISGISDGCRPLGGRYPWDWPIASQDCD
jgi:hypothetical protein